MKRRKFLAYVQSLNILCLSGCYRTNDDGDRNDPEEPSANSSNKSSVPDRTVINNNNTNNSARETTDNETVTDEDFTYDESRRDPLFIDNIANEEIHLTVRVSLIDGGDTILERSYRIPEGISIKIPNVAKVGKKYDVVVEYDDMEEDTEWVVDTCASTHYDEYMETVLYAIVEKEEISFITLFCDVHYNKDYDITEDDHEEYIVD